MSITVKVDSYSDLVSAYSRGEEILNLPEQIIDNIDAYFDGQDVDFTGVDNPDNFYINHLFESSEKDFLIKDLNYLSEREYQELVENDELENYINEHLNDIEDQTNQNFYYLGYVDNKFYFIEY